MSIKLIILHIIDKNDKLYDKIVIGGLIMNTEDYKKIEELFNKMSESDKNKLKEFLLSRPTWRVLPTTSP